MDAASAAIDTAVEADKPIQAQIRLKTDVVTYGKGDQSNTFTFWQETLLENISEADSDVSPAEAEAVA